MRSWPRQSVFVLVLISGMGLSTTSRGQIAPDAAPKSETQAASRPTSEVDLSRKNVLILHGLESNAPISELTDRGIKTVLESAGVGTRNQFFEYLDLVRNPGPDHRKIIRELMRQRYGQRKIDLVITLYPEALLFAVNEGCTIFPGSPIVALYLPDRLRVTACGRPGYPAVSSCLTSAERLSSHSSWYPRPSGLCRERSSFLG